MKIFFLAIALVITVTLCGAGFFVPQTPGTEYTVAGMVVLSDTEMAAQNGGTGQWRKEQTRKATGKFSNCAKHPCPTGIENRTFGHYRCAPCEGSESLWNRTWATKVEQSKCLKIVRPDGCKYRYNVTAYQWSCVSHRGINCGDHEW